MFISFHLIEYKLLLLFHQTVGGEVGIFEHHVFVSIDTKICGVRYSGNWWQQCASFNRSEQCDLVACRYSVRKIVFGLDLRSPTLLSRSISNNRAEEKEKTWPKKYCALYNASNHGIQRLEIFENEDTFLKQNPSKIVPLTDCVKATAAPQKQQSNVFEIRTKSNGHLFSTDSFQDMMDWLKALQTIAFGSPRPMSALNLSSQGIKEEKQEENMLYSSMDAPEVYAVKVIGTEATLRNNLQGEYNLIITAVNLSLSEECSQGRLGKIVLTWPYRHIRRYGCSKDNFSFEAGRKCASGEGLFTFATTDGMRIFQSVDGHVSALKASHNELEFPNSPSHSDDKSMFFASKDSLLVSKEPATQFPQAKLDGFSNITCRTTEISPVGFHNKLFIKKPSCPILKPPRKSKQSASGYSDISNINNPASTSNSPNFYEKVYHETTSIPSKVPQDSDKLSNIPFKNMKISECDNISSYSVPHKLSADFEDKLIKDVTYSNKGDLLRNEYSHSTTDYDQLSKNVYTSLQPDFVSSSDDRTYGKINYCSPKSSVSSQCGIVQNKVSIVGKDTSPIYSNVFVSKSLYSNAANFGNHEECEPRHFVKNDVEYAEVLKK